MNRKKKINQELKKRQKQANAKMHHSNKSPYVAKADREKIALAQGADDAEPAETLSETDLD